MKKTIQILFFLGLVIPFILQTNVYPFFRFGMFAEKISSEVQTEQFFVSTGDRGVGYLVPESIGIRKSTFDYLLRNHYYRNESQQFLRKLKTALPDSLQAKPLFMVKVTGKDTLRIQSNL